MSWLQDLRHATRALMKARGFSVIVVVTLALAIGANSAIFGVVDGVLLKPLPYADPHEIVLTGLRLETIPGEDETPMAPLSLFNAWRASSRAFDAMAMYSNQDSSLTGRERPVRLSGASVSPALFPLLGVQALHGRVFAADEERRGNEKVLLLSHRAWQSHFGGDVAAVGSVVPLDDEPHTIVGVMPAGFAFPDDGADFWVPLVPEVPDPDSEEGRRRGMFVEVQTSTGGPGDGGPDAGRGGSAGGPPGGPPAGGLPPGGQGGAPQEGVHRVEMMGRVIARLADGVTPAMAADEGQALLGGLDGRVFGPDGSAVVVTPLMELLVGGVRASLLLLMGAVGFVLLIACANVANLVMARSVERRKETAVRAAIGAGTWRIARFLFVESLMLSAVGAVGGLLLAWFALRLLATQGPEFIPRLDSIALDARALAFTAAVTVLTAVLFSLVPIRGAARLDLTRALKDEYGSGRLGGGRQLLRKLLVTAEISLSVILLVGATLLVSSFMRLTAVDPGYAPDNVLDVRLTLPEAAYADAAAHIDAYDRLLERLQAIPGVQSATVSSGAPSTRANIQIAISRSEGPVADDEEPQPMGVRVVGTGYFDAIGARFVAGRGFDDEVRAETTPVVVMSEAAARIMLGDADPVGQKVQFMGPNQLEVIGVVQDVRASGTDPVPQPDIFLPLPQAPAGMVPMLFRTATVLVRTGPAPLGLVAAVRAAVAQVDPSIEVSSVATVRDQLADAVAEPRFYATLVGSFATLAVVLAAVGIYGLLAYVVQQGVRETAIRRALGAPTREVLGGVIRQGMSLAVVGLVLGVGAALALTRLLAAMLYDVEPTDAASFALVAVVFLTVSFIAVWVPARRAMRIDPMEALRYDG